jgi:ATP-dependent RNA helicase RhlE
MQYNKFKTKHQFTKKNRSKTPPTASGIDINQYISKSKNVKEVAQYVPDFEFVDFELHAELLHRILSKGYTHPSEVQDKSIAHVLEGRDLIGIAGTGTGKTAAFLIPIIQRLLEKKQNNYALIITPTRELANQIQDEFKSLTKGLGLFSTCLIGGNAVYESIKSLGRTNHILIGTPGRLLDMNERGHLPFDAFNTLVLDEYDRMLDMGFLNDIKKIHNQMKGKEQTLLFSATLDPSQEAIVTQMTKSPVKVKAGTSTEKTHAIDQDILHVRGMDKLQMVQDLILAQADQKVILFCETKRKVDKVWKNLQKANVKTDVIHGDKTQRAREVALRKFKQGHINVLIATDVVARGIDISDVSLVINYEVPRSYTDYIHRIGRTGRAGKTGKAITLID